MSEIPVNTPIPLNTGDIGSGVATTNQPIILHATTDQGPLAFPRNRTETPLDRELNQRKLQATDQDRRVQLMVQRYLKFQPGGKLESHHVKIAAFNRMDSVEQIKFFQKLKQDPTKAEVQTQLWNKMSKKQHVKFALQDVNYIPSLTAEEVSLYSQKTAERFRNFQPGDPLQPFDRTSSAFKLLTADEQMALFQKLQQDDSKAEMRDAIWTHELPLQQKLSYYQDGKASLEYRLGKFRQMRTDNKQPYGALSEKIWLHFALEALREQSINIQNWTKPMVMEAAIQAAQRDHATTGQLTGVLNVDSTATRNHYVACDIRVEKGKVSILIFESGNPPSIAQELAIILSRVADGPIASYIKMGTQNSPADCLVYSLSAAKKAMDEQSLLQDLHRKQLAGEAISRMPVMTEEEWMKKLKGPSWEKEEDLQRREDVMRNKVVRHIVTSGGRLDVIPRGGEVLPTWRFFKHTQSKKPIEELKRFHPHLHFNTDEVNKIGRPEHGQTLDQYWNAHKVQRDHYDEKQEKNRTFEYNASIEEKRISFIEQALDYCNRKIAELRTVG